MRKFVVPALAIILIFSQVSFAVSKDNGDDSKTQLQTARTVPPSTLSQSIYNLSSINSGFLASDTFYVLDNKNFNWKKMDDNGFKVGVGQQVKLLSPGYKGPSKVKFSGDDNIFVRVGTCHVGNIYNFCDDSITYEEYFQPAGSVDLSKAAREIMQNKDSGVVINITNASEEDTVIKPGPAKNEFGRVHTMTINPMKSVATSPVETNIPAVADFASLVNDNGQVTKYVLPNTRLDVTNYVIQEPPQSIISNTYINYEFGNLQNVYITEAALDFSNVINSCVSTNIGILNVGTNWNGQDIKWENQPQGYLIDTFQCPSGCGILDITAAVREASSTSAIIGLGFKQQDIASTLCIVNQPLPVMTIKYVYYEPDETLGSYIQANWNGDCLGNDIGKEHQTFYEELNDGNHLLNTANLNFITDFSPFSLPVKGSSALSMNFSITYNSQSYIDTGVGWGWVHNYQVRLTPWCEDYLILRGSTGTLTRLASQGTTPRSWKAEKSHLMAEEFFDEESNPWIRLHHKDGTKIEFKLMPGGNYLPVKYLDCQGRYFYLYYSLDGLLTNVRNDYSSRNLEFFYLPGTTRLVKVRDNTTDPTDCEFEYGTYPSGLTYLKNIKLNGVYVYEDIEYTQLGEMKPKGLNIEYKQGEPGKVEFTDHHIPNNQEESVQRWHWRIHQSQDCHYFYDQYTTKTTEDNVLGIGYKGDPLEEVVWCDYPTNPTCDLVKLWTYTYNDYGDIKSIIKGCEFQGTTYTYDYEVEGSPSHTGQVAKVQYDAPLNKQRPETTYEYTDQCGNMMKSKNGNGSETTYEYYDNGLPRRVNHPTGETREIEYDASNQPIRLKSTSCGSGTIETTMTWTDDGKPLGINYPTGESYDFIYDQKDRLLKVTGTYPAEFSYNTKGQISQIVEGPTGHTVTSSFNYDTKGRVSSITKDSQTSSYEYLSETGLLKKVTDPQGKETNIYYNDDSTIKKIIHPGNRTEEWLKDQNGRINRYVPPDGHLITLEYTDNGRINKVSWEDGYYLTATYDDWGRPTRLTDPNGNHQDRTYKNLTNLVTSTSDEMGKTTNYTYDNAGRMTKVEAPNGAQTNLTYNPCGISEVENDLGNTASYTYDDAGRISSVTDAKGKVWSYTYQDGNLIKKTDPKNHETTYTYDDWQRPTNVYWPGVQEPEASEFTNDGLKTSFTNGENQEMQFTYDLLKRMSGVTHSDSSTITYAFSQLTGDITSITEPLGTHSFTYAASGELTRYVSPYNWQVDYTRGSGALLTSKTNPRGNYTYSYTNRRLTGFKPPELLSSVAYQYNASGRLTKKTVPGLQDVVYDYTLNDLYKASAVSVDYGTTNKYDWTYTFDDIGQRTQMQDADGTHSYTYDAMGQVTQVVDGSVTTSLVYDDAYNCSSKTVGLVTTSYTYNASDQLTQSNNGTDTIDYVYDKAGRMTSFGPHQIYFVQDKTLPHSPMILINSRYSDTTPPPCYANSSYNPNAPSAPLLTPGWTYLTYNDEGQVTKVTKPNGDTIEFTYYATGQRAKKVLKVGEDTTTWKYHWDGDIPVKIEKEGGDPAYFTFRAQGDILTMTYQNNTYYYITNIRGDVVALLDRYGNEAASYKYDIWGNPTITNPNNLPNPFLYQGAYATFHDSEFAMYGMGARHYDPKIMRFISRDFNHGSLTNTMSQNLYIHCYNNPISYKDPSGFSPSCGGRSNLRGSNDTDNFGPGDDPNPVPDGAFTNEYPAQRSAAYQIWLEAEKKTDTAANWDEFCKLWSNAVDNASKMRKYGDGLDEYDTSIAFWAQYWNDKAKLGLSGNDFIGFANEIKAITYFESTCGTNTDIENEGPMGVSTDLARANGWVSKDFKFLSDRGNFSNNKGAIVNMNKFLEKIEAGLYEGIAYYLTTAGGNIAGQNTFDGFMKLTQGQRTAIFQPSNYARIAMSYGQCNLFTSRSLGYAKIENGQWVTDIEKIKRDFKQLPGEKDTWEQKWNKYWTSRNPYGNAVHELATKGSYIGVDHERHSLLP